MTFSQRRPVSAEQYQESGEQIPTGTPGQTASLEDARPPASAKRGQHCLEQKKGSQKKGQCQPIIFVEET